MKTLTTQMKKLTTQMKTLTTQMKTLTTQIKKYIFFFAKIFKTTKLKIIFF